MFVQGFFVLITTLHLASVIVAYPEGPGSCQSPTAVSASHLIDGTTTPTGSLSDGSYKLVIDGTTQDGTGFNVQPGVTYDIELSTSSDDTFFRGFLIRFTSTADGVDSSSFLSSDDSGQVAPAVTCSPLGIGSLGHIGRTDKTSISGSLTIESPGPQPAQALGDVTLEVTVVLANDGDGSRWFYTAFPLTVGSDGGGPPETTPPVADGPTSAPSTEEVSPPPTSAPIVEASPPTSAPTEPSPPTSAPTEPSPPTSAPTEPSPPTASPTTKESPTTSPTGAPSPAAGFPTASPTEPSGSEPESPTATPTQPSGGPDSPTASPSSGNDSPTASPSQPSDGPGSPTLSPSGSAGFPTISPSAPPKGQAPTETPAATDPTRSPSVPPTGQAPTVTPSATSPTPEPGPVPTTDPTPSPTTSAGLTPFRPVRMSNNQCSPTNKCVLCEGDCDFDDDCEGDLVCFQKGHDVIVPSCVNGLGSQLDGSRTDWCIEQSSIPPPPPSPVSTPVPFMEVRVPSNPCSDNKCNRCEGDCHTNSDCKEGLVCFQQDGGGSVPGCVNSEGTNIDNSKTDWCIPEELKVSSTQGQQAPPSENIEDRAANIFLPVRTSDNLCSPSNKCTECEGDCDTSDDCADGLVCYQKGGNEHVPGCVNGVGSSFDGSRTDWCLPKDSAGTLRRLWGGRIL